MAERDVVVVGASAGGVEAMRSLMAGLPADLPAAVLVVLHLPPSGSSALVRILDRSGPLPAEPPTDGQHLKRGRVYVAPPDHHLLVRDGHLSLSRGPQENGHRPAVDPLFRSAAQAHGPRTVGVVLSGTLDDGASGLAAIARRGGAAVVQDPHDALYAGMPMAALAEVPDALIAPVAALGGVVTRLVRNEDAGATPATAKTDSELHREVAIAEFDLAELGDPHKLGEPAGLGCPDCSGALFEVRDGGLVRYRCRVGHAWSAEALTSRQSQGLETALWMALRTLEDKAALHRRMAEAAEARSAEHLAAWSWRSAREAADSARLIRERLIREPPAAR